ncbi:MAG: S41 family peptidase [Planctomycetes bacterium]|nr:S41 family peptidase [Planctomycetota bacterium]
MTRPSARPASSDHRHRNAARVSPRVIGLLVALVCLLSIFFATHNNLTNVPADRNRGLESQITRPQISQTNFTSTAEAPRQSLNVAIHDLAAGRFEKARERLSQGLSSLADKSLLRGVQNLLASYENIEKELHTAHVNAYEKRLKDMVEAVNLTNWNQSLLDASQGHNFESSQKAAFEKEIPTKIKRHWLAALMHLGVSNDLADRTGLALSGDPQILEKIISKNMDIARQLEDQGKWLEAYSRYSYLATLDKTNSELDKHADELLRRATLVAMYVQDPNQDAVTWQERRRGINFQMIRKGLKVLKKDYVINPNFKEMIDKALQYCLLIAKTQKLSDTFDQLNDPQKINHFRDEITALLDVLDTKQPEQLNDSHVLSTLRQVLTINKQSLAIPEDVLMAEYAEGAFASLDGYTYIIWPGDVENFQKDMTNEFTGVGIVISNATGPLKVESLLQGYPAMRAGLDAGDIIAAIDGKKTTNITMEMAVRRITGPAGTDVVLSILREGSDEPKDYSIVRERIVVRTVEGLYRNHSGQWEYFLDRDRDIAYIRLTGFAAETTRRFKSLMRRLEQENMRGLILDLRGNSGGYLSAAIRMVNFFISSGRIVSTRSPRAPKREIINRASVIGTLSEQLPLVVLVNSSSASASEILAGALQDHDRALITGTQTFGKGSVQDLLVWNDSPSEMKITVAYYYLPNGRRVHRDTKDKTNEDYGVIPDVVVELTNTQIINRYNVRRDASVLRRNGQSDEKTKRKNFTAQDILESDPQLSVALLCLKARLLAKTVERPTSTNLVQN